jgi:two-component system nitrogen regulation response regulator NtrX
MCASSHPPTATCRQIAARFREDLFYRERGAGEGAGPHERRETSRPWCIIHAADGAGIGLPERDIGEDAMTALQAHTWPGTPSLRNVVEWLLIMAPARSQQDPPDMLPEILDISGRAAGTRRAR